MEIKHILVATDLSEWSTSAYPYAAGLAKACGARLTLLHVDETSTLGFHPSKELATYLDHAAEARAALLAKFADILRGYDVDVDLAITSGLADEQILYQSERLGVDLIVVTGQGENRREGLMVGSTSRLVLRGTDRPVLVVPARDQVETEARPWRRMMTATDFSPDSDRGGIVAIALATLVGASLNFVHVLRVPRSLEGEPALEGQLPAENRVRLDKLRRGVLAQVVDTIGPDMSHTVVSGDRVPEALIRAAAESETDVIVIPSHGKGAIRATLLGSTSERLVELADTPVLVLPRDYLKRVIGR